MSFIQRGVIACVLLLLGVVETSKANDCHWLDEEIRVKYGVENDSSTPAEELVQVRTELATLLGLARQCHTLDTPEKLTWVTSYEIAILDKLGRETKAEAVTEWYFEHIAPFYEDPVFRSEMYVRRFRFRAQRGDLVGASMAFQEGMHAHGQESQERQLSIQLDGSYVYIRMGAYKQALEVIAQVEAVNERSDLVRGRIAVQRAEMLLHEAHDRIDLLNDNAAGEATRLLIQSIDFFKQAGDSLRIADSKATLAYILSRHEGSSEEVNRLLDESIDWADEAKQLNTLIYAWYRKGLVERIAGDFDEALFAFDKARNLINESERTELQIRVLEALGQTFAELARKEEAHQAFGTVIASASTSQDLLHQRALQRAELGIVSLAESAVPVGFGKYAFLGIALFLLGLTLGFNLRNKSLSSSENMSIQTLSVPKLQPPVPRNDPPSLFDRRLMYIYTVLTEPERVLPHVEDPFLKERIEKKDIQLRSILYTLAAALETYKEGTVFENDPANTLGTYLRKWFKKNDWIYPADLHGWRAFFSSRPD